MIERYLHTLYRGEELHQQVIPIGIRISFQRIVNFYLKCQSAINRTSVSHRDEAYSIRLSNTFRGKLQAQPEPEGKCIENEPNQWLFAQYAQTLLLGVPFGLNH